MTQEAPNAELIEHFENFYMALDEGDLAAAEKALATAEKLAPQDPEVWFARGNFALESAGPEIARPHFQRVIEAQPEHSDAHACLAMIAGELGDTAKMIEHNLKVWQFDVEDDAQAGYGPEHVELISGIAERALAEIPEEFQKRMENVTVSVVERPTREMVQEGVDPRVLALFSGPNDAEVATNNAADVTNITLFYANLLAEFGDSDDLEGEILITILHEVAHFFGLDEEEVAALGLE